MITNKTRMKNALCLMCDVTNESEALRIWAKNVPPSTRYDITADFAELIAWAVARRVANTPIPDNIPFDKYSDVSTSTSTDDLTDLIDTQECARV